eukprot:10876443-Ditylum_brightwellii.AAC.1
MPLSTPTPQSSNINSSNVAVSTPSLHQDEKEDTTNNNKDDSVSVQQHQQLERDYTFPAPNYEYENDDTYSINLHTSAFSTSRFSSSSNLTSLGGVGSGNTTSSIVDFDYEGGLFKLRHEELERDTHKQTSIQDQLENKVFVLEQEVQKLTDLHFYLLEEMKQSE